LRPRNTFEIGALQLVVAADQRIEAAHQPRALGELVSKCRADRPPTAPSVAPRAAGAGPRSDSAGAAAVRAFPRAVRD